MKKPDVIPIAASKSNDSIITVFQVCRKITENGGEKFAFSNGDGKNLVENPSLINLVKLAGKRTDQGTEYIFVPITSWERNTLVAGNMNSLGENTDTIFEQAESISNSDHHDMAQYYIRNNLNKPYVNNFSMSDSSNHNNPFKSCFPFFFRKKDHSKK